MINISASFAKREQILSNLNIDNELYIYAAASEYEKGNFSEAAEILEARISKSTANIAAKILLSKVYAQLGKYQLAVHQLKKSCELINSPKTFEYYLQEIDSIQKKDTIRFDSELSEPLDYKFTADETEIQSSTASESKSYETLLVSETLAKIYSSQGEFSEAIKIYEKLLDRKPESREKYLQAIEELKTRLGK